MRCDNEDADQQPKSSYWTQQLFNYEANDSGRFVCIGWNIFLLWDFDRIEILPHFHHHGDCIGPGNLYIHPKKRSLETPAGGGDQKPKFKDEAELEIPDGGGGQSKKPSVGGVWMSSEQHT